MAAPVFCSVCGSPMVLLKRYAGRYDSATGAPIYETETICSQRRSLRARFFDAFALTTLHDRFIRVDGDDRSLGPRLR